MSLSQLNEYARRHGFHELPDLEEIDDVLPWIRNYLKEYDLSDSAVSSEKWNELMEYIDFREARRKLRGTVFL